jgi:GntR family transcriptional regulator
MQYDELANELSSQILAGDYNQPDQPFPSIREISDNYGVTRNTASRAVQKLSHDGLIVLRNRARPLVARQEARPTTWPLTGRYARARAAQGLVFSNDVGGLRKDTIDRRWAPAPVEVAELLEVGPRTKVLHRRSRTYADGQPIEETTMHFPRAVVDDAPQLDEAGDIKVVAMIEATGRTIDRTVNRLRARPASADEAEALHLSPGSIVFEHTHCTYTDAGEAVEAVINIKPAEDAVLTFDTYEGPTV